MYEDFTNQAYIQTVFSRKFAIGVGVEHKKLKVFTETISSLEQMNLLTIKKRLYFDKSNYFNLISYLKLTRMIKNIFKKMECF